MNVFNLTLFKPLLVVSLGLSLFACGEKKAEQPQEPAQTNTQTTQEQPKSGDTLTVAVTQDFAPFTYLDETGGLVGFDIDVVKAIAKNKGLNIQFKATTFDNLFTEVDRNSADIGASGIFYKEERASKYGLTNPYHTDRPVFYYRKDNEKLANVTLTSLADLNKYSLRVAVVGDVEGLNNNHQITPVKSEFVGFAGVLQNKYDVAFSDESVLNHAIKSNPEASSTPLTTVHYQGDVGYVMIVNKDNATLLQTLNEGIDELTKNGEIAQLRQKYGLD